MAKKAGDRLNFLLDACVEKQGSEAALQAAVVAAQMSTRLLSENTSAVSPVLQHMEHRNPMMYCMNLLGVLLPCLFWTPPTLPPPAPQPYYQERRYERPQPAPRVPRQQEMPPADQAFDRVAAEIALDVTAGLKHLRLHARGLSRVVHLVLPEIAEPLGRKFAISNRMLDVLVAEIVLQRPSIHTLIGQLEPS